LDDVVRRVAGSQYGAVVTFSGNIRLTENNAAISAITYEAYAEMAEQEISKIVDRVKTKWAVVVALRHKLGMVAVGEASLVVACAGVHRRETFEACQFVVDQIKANVPIWKVGYAWV
jgi:molybdopterin synthase catalytic subunit